MRKFILSLAVLLTSLCCFASERVGEFSFSAYYGAASVSAEYVNIVITEAESGAAVNYNGDVNVSNQTLNTKLPVFNWTLYSNTEKNVTVLFAMSPLQAEVDGTYYIPKHTFYIQATSADFDPVLSTEYDLQLDTDYTAEHTIVFSWKQSGDRPYPGNYGGIWGGQEYEHFGQLTTSLDALYQYTDYGTGTNWKSITSDDVALYRSDWSLSGTCKLYVYDADIPSASIEYVSNVNIEITVD